MLAHMKKRPTKKVSKLQLIIGNKKHVYVDVPSLKIQPILKSLVTLDKYKVDLENVPDYVEFDALMEKDLKKMGGDERYRQSAYMVRSARKSEEMTQVGLCKKLKIDQRNLSQIENAKRPVGKGLAKKLSTVFNINYKVFLSD